MRLKLSGPELQQLRFKVFERDGWRCVALTLDRTHMCSGPFGIVRPDQWGYRDILTLEHVNKFSGTGIRADDREEETLTLCIGANSWTGWANVWRHEERKYLAERYPDHWANVPEVQP